MFWSNVQIVDEVCAGLGPESLVHASEAASSRLRLVTLSEHEVCLHLFLG